MKKSPLTLLGLLLVGILVLNACMKPTVEDLQLETTVVAESPDEPSAFEINLPSHLENATLEEIQTYFGSLSAEDLERLQDMDGINRGPSDCTEINRFCNGTTLVKILECCQNQCYNKMYCYPNHFNCI